MATTLLFGTTNPGKIRELRRLVAGLPLEVIAPGDLPGALPEVEEDGATFEENAAKKALAWARFSGHLTVADDSGLCVDALGGAPGVRSARWSELSPGPASPACALGEVGLDELGPEASRAVRDEKNNDKLLASLGGVPDERRGAEYRAVLALAFPDGRLAATVAGRCRGRIGYLRRGAHGFGYDPLFLPQVELDRVGAPGDPAAGPRTMAELSAAEKDALSHRGEAFRALLPVLAKLAGSAAP